MHVQYTGSLTCKAEHLKSGSTLNTDAPTDNNGKGGSFSPSDLLCTSLAACMVTIMGISAEKKNIRLGRIEAAIQKIMAPDPPRRVGEIHIVLKIEDTGYTDREKEILKNAALTCPVALSIHPDIRQEVEFKFE
jgi:uncharacterized OsmC-like protein